MRTLILTAAVALLGTATFAQEKTATPAKTTTTPTIVDPNATSDALNDERRVISGELKTTLGQTESLLSKAMSMVKEAKPEDHDKYMKIADGLKNVQADLMNHLGLVNRATEKDSKQVFAAARTANASNLKLVEGYKTDLMPAAGPVGTETKPVGKDQPVGK